jgi:poly(3-hydroxybutyrate) depolymerase
MRKLFLCATLVLAAMASPLALEHGYASEPPGTPDTANVVLPGVPALSLDTAVVLAPGPAKDAAATQLEFLGVPHSQGCGLPRSAGDFVEQLDGRSFRIHVPARYDPTSPASLVLNFHGYGRTAEEQETYSGLVPLSDSAGFLLVTPDGSGSPQGWNIVGVYAEDGVDDVSFAVSLVDQLGDEFCVSPGRVYAIGFSNGAEMASQLACDHPDMFAAVAAVSGLIYQGCDGRPVAVTAFHGTDDENVFYDWIPDEREGWANHNGCTGAETNQVTEHVTALVATGCAAGADVVLYTIDGGGHAWPGAADDAGGAGFTTHEIDASTIASQ